GTGGFNTVSSVGGTGGFSTASSVGGTGGFNTASSVGGTGGFITFVSIIKKCLYPIMLVTQMIPTIIIAPLFMIWFGFGTMPKVLM
ncbi:hypothetical protein ACTPD5_21025, partial [Clostridioides difficile]